MRKIASFSREEKSVFLGSVIFIIASLILLFYPIPTLRYSFLGYFYVDQDFLGGSMAITATLVLLILFVYPPTHTKSEGLSLLVWLIGVISSIVTFAVLFGLLIFTLHSLIF